MESSSIERSAVSAAVPINPTPYGADFRIIQALGPLTEWRTHGVHYAEFASKALDFEVRVGYSIDYEDEYPDPEVLEVWIGRADLTLHLNDAALELIGEELSAHLELEARRNLDAAHDRHAESLAADQMELTL